MLVQIDADPRSLRRAQKFLLVIVPEGVAGARPVKAPGLSVVTQTAFVVIAFALHVLESNTNGDLHSST